MNDLIFIRQIDVFLYSVPMLIVQMLGAVVAVALFILWLKLIRNTRIYAMKFDEIRDAFSETPIRHGRIANKWASVEKRMRTNDESEWKIAIIEADSILDEIIQQLGYRGVTMDERMAAIRPEHFPYLEDAIRVHKVRDFIAHDTNYKLQHAVAERAIEIYYTIFSEFNVVG